MNARTDNLTVLTYEDIRCHRKLIVLVLGYCRAVDPHTFGGDNEIAIYKRGCIRNSVAIDATD
jgi:hypothetical protein